MRQAKVEVPARAPQFVERPAVREALHAAATPVGSGRVVLVSAPAGHGKTAALADWVRASETPTAWLSLDRADRAEHQWWSSVLGALMACPGVPSNGALHHDVAGRLSGRETEAREAFLLTLLEALDELPEPIRLVLDDVHEIIGHEAHRGLRDLVRHRVRGLTVVLSSRLDPPIGLDRLRLDGRLGEVRADRLAFGVEDAIRFFDAAAVPLTADEAATLVGRTEGWVAALRLVALSLQSATDRSSVVADFAGDDRSVADYLVDEVLSVLDDRERRVLEAACLCPTVPVDLARALTGGEAAAEVLERLEASTGLITAVDRRRERYRAHELLRSHVLARLRRAHAERLRTMHQRAAVWFEIHDDPGEAVRVAAAAGDVGGTTSLVRARGAELVAAGRFTELGEAARLLWSQDAAVPAVLALGALEDGGPARAEALLRASDDADPEIAVVRSMVDARRTLADGRSAHVSDPGSGILPERAHSTALRALALAGRAAASSEAAPDDACADGEAALALAAGQDWEWLEVQGHTALAVAHARTGRLPMAVEHAHAVLERCARHRWQHTVWQAEALVVLALSDAVDGRPEQALADVAAAEALEPAHREHRNVLTAVRGIAEYDRGRRREGWQLLRAARVQALAEDLDRRQVAFTALLEQEAALGLGRVREADDVTRAVGARLKGTGDEAVLQARQRWVATRDPQVRATLQPALDGSRPCTSPLAALEARVLDAEIALARGQHPLVRRRLQEAARRAGERAAVRPLAAASPALLEHLERDRGSFGEHDQLIDRVLSLAHARSGGPVVMLTDREREVLELLPSMRSVDEIAEDLAVSPNTIKTHQRAIYHKLGADGRRDAVRRARRAGLLTPAG